MTFIRSEYAELFSQPFSVVQQKLMTTQAATRSFKEFIPKVLPPPSPFGELLRQSKFASYDPCIRQTYSAPPSYTQRGNFGLKRPISNRKSHAYIVLKDFEEHAHYIDWDNAKGQVKWMKQMEELYITPKLKTSSSWALGLGPSATSIESGLDSEFCPGELSMVQRTKLDETGGSKSQAPNNEQTRTESSEDSTMKAVPPEKPDLMLPKSRGKGGYGVRAEINPSNNMFLQPNISSMPTAVFRRYREKLRKLHPEFVTFVREELKKRWKANASEINPHATRTEDIIPSLGPLILDYQFHLRFMGQKTEADYTESSSTTETEQAERMQLIHSSDHKPQRIRPQPHKFGGLMYAQPTLLETRLINKPQPGIYLEVNTDRFTRSDVASFAGMTAQFKHLGVGAKPLFEAGTGPNLDDVSQGTRMMSPKTVTITSVPKVVGRAAPSKPMQYVEMRAVVDDDAGVNKNHQDNPYTPGTYEYNSLAPPNSRMRLRTPRIPDRAHSRHQTWGLPQQNLGSMLYDLGSKSWQNTRAPGAFDPNSRSPQFRRLDSDKGSESDFTLKTVGSLMKRTERKGNTLGEEKPADK